MLRVDDLVVRYGRSVAVRGISFSVETGETLAIVGPNGAGKTSSLHAIVGLVPVAGGHVRLADAEVTGTAPEVLLRAGVALVPEGRHVFASLTVLENLRLGTTIRRDRAVAEREIGGLLDRFEALGRARGRPAGSLSGGEQQQLAIARAMLCRPRVLMLDEPSLGLAPLIVDQVFELLEQLRADGVTIVLVEQNAARAVTFADRSIVLQGGEVAMSGTASELLGTAQFVASYLGVAPEDAGPALNSSRNML